MSKTRLRVVADTCVLYPPSFRDILVQLALNDEIELLLPDLVLVELENRLAKIPQVGPERAKIATQKLSATLTTVLVTPGPEANDLKILSCARDSQADVLVTQNTRHFASNTSMSVLTLSQLLATIERRNPGLMELTLSQVVERYKKPEVTLLEQLKHLERMGLEISGWRISVLTS